MKQYPTPQLVLCAASGSQAVVIDTATGTRYPVVVPRPLGALDHVLHRQGWTALDVGSVLAMPDGRPVRPKPVSPAACRLVPAYNQEKVLATGKHWKGLGPAELSIQLIGPLGIESELMIPESPIGQLANGDIITCDERIAMNGTRIPLCLEAPWQAISVLSGTILLLINRDTEQLGLMNQQGTMLSIASVNTRKFWKAEPNPTNSAVLCCFSSPDLIVASDDGTFTVVSSSDFGWRAWLTDNEIAHGQERVIVVNYRTGEHWLLPRLEKQALLGCLTGRFMLDELERLGPQRKTSVSPETALQQSESRVLALLAEHPRLHNTKPLPAIRIESHPPSRGKTGATPSTGQLGGRPMLPPGVKWPLAGGRPMAFLGQFRTDELRRTMPDWELRGLPKIPEDSLLSFFALMEPDSASPVENARPHVRVDPSSDLKRLAWPKTLPKELRYSEASISLQPCLSLPAVSLEAFDDDWQAWEAFMERARPDAPPNHQLFGFSNGYPDDYPKGMRLVLQLDSDGLMDSHFGDGGCLRFWMPWNTSLVEGAGATELDMESC